MLIEVHLMLCSQFVHRLDTFGSFQVLYLVFSSIPIDTVIS